MGHSENGGVDVAEPQRPRMPPSDRYERELLTAEALLPYPHVVLQGGLDGLKLSGIPRPAALLPAVRYAKRRGLAQSPGDHARSPPGSRDGGSTSSKAPNPGTGPS